MNKISQYEHMAEEIRKTWIEALKDVQSAEEYNQSMVTRLAEVEMKRLIMRAFDINSHKLKEDLKSSEPGENFDTGAQYFKNRIADHYIKEGKSFEAEQLWRFFKEQRSDDLKKAYSTLEHVNNLENVRPLTKYMFFLFGLQSIINVYHQKFGEIPVINLQEEEAKVKYKLKKLQSGISQMDKNFNEDKGIMESFSQKIKNLLHRITKIEQDSDQLASEIRGEVDKVMLPRLGELEQSFQDVNKRMRTAEYSIKALKRNLNKLEEAAKANTEVIQRLEEMYNENIKKIYEISEKFKKNDDQYLVIQKEIFENLGGNKSAILDSLEYSLSSYGIDEAILSKRISSQISNIEQKISSTSQYNTTIPHFWVTVLKYVCVDMYYVKKAHDTFESSVNINWQKGIEEVFNGVDQIFTDKDALRAMKSVSDYKVPLFNDGATIWDKYNSTSTETKKKLYEKMKSYGNSSTFLRIAIPSILSSAILKAARYKGISEFIWFCSVTYDDMWNRYGNLLNEMVKRRAKNG
jgi:uncharacterized protein YoxC